MEQRLDRQRTGSVYLDQPIARPDRRNPHRRPRRGRRTSIAAALLGVGVACVAVAALLAGIRSVAFAPQPWVDAVDETLENPTARAEIERDIADGIEQGMVGEEAVEAMAFYGFDVPAEAERVAGIVLDDDAVRDELRDLVATGHARVIGEADAEVDLAPISAAVLAVLERETPELATLVPADATLWTVEPDSFPDLGWAADLTDRALLALTVGIVLLAVGVVVQPDRHIAASWIGRALLVGGLTAALVAVGAPYLAGGLTGWTAAEIATRALTIRLLAPAAIAGIIGMGVISFGAIMRHRAGRRVADEGAAAALGYDEPPLWSRPNSPTLDLAHRGLVDVNHPLTNI